MHLNEADDDGDCDEKQEWTMLTRKFKLLITLVYKLWRSLGIRMLIIRV